MQKTNPILTKSARRRVLGAVTLALGMSVLTTVPVQAEGVTLVETGSTLLYPLFNIWVANYTKTHPGVCITTASTGSEMGIQKILAGEVHIGASDAFMSDTEVKRHPQIANIPLCIAAQMVNYNLPGLNAEQLKLDGTVLAGIYYGKVHDWDAAPIAALNPGIKLPHHAIIPIRRSDGSGDTFIFTQFLCFSDPAWADKTGYGMTVNWPVVEGNLEAAGNAGMVQTTQKTPYSLAYIGVSYAADIGRAGIGTAWLKNESGNFLLPTKEAVQAAAADLSSRTPADERLSIVLSPGAEAYPLVSYEYAVVSTKQVDSATASALRKFLLWSIVPSETNESYLDSVHFIGLPPHIWELSQAQIQTIK